MEASGLLIRRDHRHRNKLYRPIQGRFYGGPGSRIEILARIAASVP